MSLSPEYPNSEFQNSTPLDLDRSLVAFRCHMTSSPEASSTLWREWHLDTEKKPGFLKKKKSAYDQTTVCISMLWLLLHDYKTKFRYSTIMSSTWSQLNWISEN